MFGQWFLRVKGGDRALALTFDFLVYFTASIFSKFLNIHWCLWQAKFVPHNIIQDTDVYVNSIKNLSCKAVWLLAWFIVEYQLLWHNHLAFVRRGAGKGNIERYFHTCYFFFSDPITLTLHVNWFQCPFEFQPIRNQLWSLGHVHLKGLWMRRF